MNGFLGADPDALIDVGLTMRTRGRRLDELSAEITALIGAVPWHGPDAEAFRATASERAAAPMVELGLRLGSGAEDLFRHAAQQDLASSPDGSVDAAKYAGLLGGSSWSDIIDAAQDAWEATPFDDPLTIDDLGGRFIDSPEGQGFDPASVDLTAAAIRSQVMRQGALGDCWFLSALQATAAANPEFLANNVRLNDDGTWTVRLYENGAPVDVVVRPDEIARDGARVDNDGSANTWGDDPLGYMSIYEQAAINRFGPDYESVIADSPQQGLEVVTGGSAEGSELWAQPSASDLATALEEGRSVTVMTDPIKPLDDNLAAAHVYQVKEVDPATNEVVLINPWGDGAGKPYEVRIPVDGAYSTKIVMTGVGPRPSEYGQPMSGAGSGNGGGGGGGW